MKKTFVAILIVALLATMSVVAFAANTTGGEAVIETSIAPTYTVTIPANVIIDFNATKTDFGAIVVTAAQIHPNKCIKVTIITDKKLENSTDETKVIEYDIMDAEGNPFTSATYLTEGDKTELSIHITEDSWNKAYAGEYSDTVTFDVSYVDVQ